MDEFDIIARYFRPLAGVEGLALLDDAACVLPPAGKDLIITKDLLAADVHFRAEDHPTDIAWKALAVNVSDLAAKGAQPWLYFLGLGLGGGEDSVWLRAFADGLKQAQNNFGLVLGGGDTIRTAGRLTLSITAFGLVPRGQMIRRSTAQIGDDIYVTGNLGDAVLGLKCLKEGRYGSDYISLTDAYLRPNPPFMLGPELRGIATSAADISDGLVADIGHIAKASNVCAEITLDAVPLSDAALQFSTDRELLRRQSATGGDDYQLVFTCSPLQRRKIFTLCKGLSVKVTQIGEIITGSGVNIRGRNGQLTDLGPGGYRHV